VCEEIIGQRTSARWHSDAHSTMFLNEEEQHAVELSTDSLDKLEFIKHIRWLNSQMSSDVKKNRILFMAIACSLMNVSHDSHMSQHFAKLSKVVVHKLEQAADFKEGRRFAADLKVSAKVD
jgi:hypothetical protein